MAKVLLEEGKRCSWKVTRHALMSVAAAISLLAAVPAPGSAQTSSPCDDTDVVGESESLDALRADCRALWAFYNRLSDPGSLDDAGTGQWGASNSIYAWEGLTIGLSNEEYRVTGLSLYNSGLRGSISAEVGKLTELESLDLSYNSLSGSIPTAIGKLTKLGELELGNNSLRGRIPTDIGKLTNLERLQLRRNSLTGRIPTDIGKLTNLEYLNLSGNSLTGRIPTNIGKLTNLEYLNLSGNRLSGSIPSAIGDLTNLEDLDLSYMNLSGSLPTKMSNLTNLQYLYLQNNRLRMGVLPGSIPTALSQLNLAFLNLDNNIFLNPTPPPEGDNGEGDNEGEGEGDNGEGDNEGEGEGGDDDNEGEGEGEGGDNEGEGEGGDGDNEGEGEGGGGDDNEGEGEGEGEGDGDNGDGDNGDGDNGNQGEGDSGEGEGDEGSTQTDSPCDSTDVVEETLDALRADCRALWAFYNRLSDPGSLDDAGTSQWGASNSIYAWRGVTIDYDTAEHTRPRPAQLRVVGLSLYNSGLRGSISAEIGNLTELKNLDLSYNSLSGSIPTAIGNLTKLGELELGNNSLTGRIPTAIGNLTNLRRLQLRNNDLRGSIPTAIGNLTKLEYLNLSGNNHTGTIPTAIGNLTNLKYLNFSRNIWMSGSIPAAIGNLTNLEDLDLSYMNLSGSLPTEMRNLTSLQNAYLQYNRLRMGVLPGSIPAALSQLNLVFLNLDNNIFLNPTPPTDGDNDNDEGDGSEGDGDSGESRILIGPGRYRDREGRIFIGPRGEGGIGPVAEVGEIDGDPEPPSEPGPGEDDGQPVGRFADDDRSVHQANIEVIADRGITLGCDPTRLDRFCPDREITRAQMMAFLARALSVEGDPEAENSFGDVADDAWYLPYLARLAELGVAQADPDGNFRPLDPLTRADMAVLLTRAFAHITAVAEPTGVFEDVPANAPYAGEVEAILNVGITRGCSNQPMLYCPDNTVTRAQMASFLAQALESAP